MHGWLKTGWKCLWSLAAVLLISCGGGELPGARLTPAEASITSTSATFPSPRANYTVTNTGSAYSVVDTVGSEGTASVPLAVQTLVFSDVSINLGINAKATALATADLQTLIELYIAYFNRVPDADGLSYWIDQFKAGQSLDQIGQQFYGSALQFSSLTGYTSSMSDADFLALVYKNVLGRASVDAQGLNYWTTSLANGSQNRGTLVRTILAAAHAYKGDATYGAVADLLDNKASVGNYFAVTLGLSYANASTSITRGMAIAAAVTSAGTSAALGLIGVSAISDPTAPTITSVVQALNGLPVSRASPGTTLYINGSNFGADSSVALNGVALSVMAVSASRLTVAAPSASGVAGALVVSTGGRSVNFPGGFRVANTISSVAWSGSRFVAAGSAGGIYTSPDGVAWSTRSSGTTLPLIGTACSPVRCVVVGAGGLVYASADGVTFSTQATALALNNAMQAAIWTGSQFLATGGGSGIATSPDGLSWVVQRSGGTDNYVAATWTGSQFGVVGFSGSDNVVLTSAGGITWTKSVFWPFDGVGSRAPRGIAWTGSQFVVVGAGFGGNAMTSVATSADGVSWTTRNSGTANALNGVVWTGSALVAVGDGGTILASTDGTAWVARNSGVTTSLKGIVWSGAQFVAVGEAGMILTSPDSLVWTVRN
jgi:hypothetical protein